MHYLQLMYTYAPAWGFGGPSRIMYDYARWFVNSGSGADVIAGDIHHDYTAITPRQEVLDGIRIQRVTVFFKHLVKRALNCVSPAMLFLAFRSVRGRAGVTVVHIAELRSPVFLYAAVLRRIAPRQVVLVHSAFGMLHGKLRWRRRMFDPLLMGFMLRSVDVGLAQNQHELDVYREYCRRYGAHRTRIEMLPLHTPGPPRDAVEAAADDGLRQDLRRRHGVPADAFVCIFLGRLNHEKGILRTIDAFEEFAARLGSQAMLLVVGRDDGFQDAITAHIAARGAGQRVRVVNDVYQQRFEYYALADLFLGFPTIYEETMLASVEALSCGTPVLVSREADLPFVESGGAGFVIDFSVDGAVERMNRVVASRADFRHMARRVALERFADGSVCTALQRIVTDATTARETGV
jgi:glycosyltransferase involved in cell wall biosynthesis